MRWSVGPVGVKDLFTLVNLMGGVFAIYFVLQGKLDYAGYAMLGGFLLGDCLDGLVARATGTSNRFGGELDTAADHFVQGIVPGVIVYAVYARGGHGTAGFILMAILIACATVRQALFSVATLDNKLIYCGLPRTVSGYAAMSFALSTLFFEHSGIGYTAGLVLIPLLGVLGLMPIPYMSHKGARRMQGYVKVAAIGFLISIASVPLFARQFTFDVLFIFMFGYAMGGWIPILPDERRAFWDSYKRWAAEVSR